MRKRGEVSREERRGSRKQAGRRETLEGGPSESDGLATVHRSSDLCRVKASPSMLSMCDPANLFFTSKFSYLIFCNPTHNTETRTANRSGITT
jgi:hypothetical protein